MRIATTQVWVQDQDEALDFYTTRLGMEVREDVTMPEMGNFRWLTVGPVGQPDVSIVLMAVPGPPVFDAETAEQIRVLTAKGAASAIFLTTMTATPPTRSSRLAESSSSTPLRSGRTASTPRSGIRPGTTSGSRS